MSGPILLPFTGSQESLYASQLAWALAEQTNSIVDAQHVIDIRGALEFVGLEKPGLVGSGPYLASYETVCQALREIAEKLEDAYDARVTKEIHGKVFLDEGEPIEEICRRLQQHDLAIIGHRQRRLFSWPECQTIKLSLAEMLVHYALAPILIVQKPVVRFSEIAVFLSMDHVNVRFIRNCMSFAGAIGAKPSLTFLASGQHEAHPLDFVRDLKCANPELETLPVRLLARTDAPAQISPHHLRGTLDQENVLCVLSTIDKGAHRITSSGECPSALLRRLAFDALLLWPEECDRPLFADQTAFDKSQLPEAQAQYMGLGSSI